MRPIALLALIGLLAASPAAPPSHDGTLTLNVRNATLSAVLDLVATQSDVNIVVDGSAPNQTITLRLNHVTLAQALAAIESAYDLAGVWQGTILHLGDPETLARRYPGGAGIDEHIFVLHNASADDVAPSLTAALPAGTLIVPNDRTNTILVKSTPSLIAEASMLVSTFDIPAGGVQQLSIPTHNILPSTAVTTLRAALAPRAPNALVANDPASVIVASGTPDFLAQVRGTVFDLDQPGTDIRLDVRVTDITPNNDSANVGLAFGGVSVSGSPGASTGNAAYIFGSALTASMFNATLNFLVSQGTAQILATPSILALNNEQATFNDSEQLPVIYTNLQAGVQQVQFVNAGVILKMTPSISTDGWITCALDVTYSQVLSYDTQGYPIIGNREVTSTMRVRNDQSIVIGGLFQDFSSTTVQKIPLLSDIPIVGQLFKNRQTSRNRDQVVFVVTPHIVTPTDFTTPLPSPTVPPSHTSHP